MSSPASGAAGLVAIARSATAGGDDGAEIVFGEAQVLAHEGAGDQAPAGFAAEPGLADGQPLGRGCGRAEESARFAGVGELGVPRWLEFRGVRLAGALSSVCMAASK